MNAVTHPFITRCQEMRRLSMPLNKIGIDYLSFTRIYKNGARICLSSQQTIIEDYFATKKYLFVDNERHPDNYQNQQIIVWSSLPYQKTFHEAQAMGAGHGIYLMVPENEAYLDSFGFAISIHNETILNSYFNNMALLKKFTDYFYDQSKDLLAEAEQNKLILPFNQSKPIPLFQSDQLEKLLIDSQKGVKLSKRQLECVKLLMKGMRYKEIAHVLKLSPRTIEAYITQLKEKLECRNKAELIIKLMEVVT